MLIIAESILIFLPLVIYIVKLLNVLLSRFFFLKDGFFFSVHYAVFVFLFLVNVEMAETDGKKKCFVGFITLTSIRWSRMVQPNKV